MTWTLTIKALTPKGERAIQSEIVDMRNMKLRDKAAFRLIFTQEVRRDPFRVVLTAKNPAVGYVKPDVILRSVADALLNDGCAVSDFEVLLSE